MEKKNCRDIIFSQYIVKKKHYFDKNWLQNPKEIISIIASAGIILPSIVCPMFLQQDGYSYYRVSSKLCPLPPKVQSSEYL